MDKELEALDPMGIVKEETTCGAARTVNNNVDSKLILMAKLAR